MLGLSHVCLGVKDLDSAREFYAEGAGFEVVGEAGRYLDLDGRGATLRLELAGRGDRRRATLRLQTNDVEKSVVALVAAGAELVRAPAANEDLEWIAELADPDGNRLLPWRRLSEDEWNFAPELPKTRSWKADAEELLQSLLARVPVHFREIARRGTTAEAEHLAQQQNHVTREEVVRAYIRATPRMMRDRVRAPLKEHGFSPDDYPGDFAI
jgi:catechol 2,3-dioxygenase-like lactoylglutathione lyase family enzyme